MNMKKKKKLKYIIKKKQLLFYILKYIETNNLYQYYV